MFTGIIEEIGIMRRADRRGQSMVLTIEARKVLEDVSLGDSIAVNGVCLTVVAFDGSNVSMDVMPETYRQTNLRQLTPGSRVNLERAMSARGRFGGHIVQGHVDTTAQILSRDPEENAVVFRMMPADPQVLKFVIPRGSITIDGISLTVVDVSEGTFAVSIIPHTLAETVLKDKHPGDTVNVETDVLGKYVDHLLHWGKSGGAAEKPSSRLTESFLAENGFM